MSMYHSDVAELATKITAAVAGTGTIKNPENVCELYKAIYETIKECDDPRK